ncbi:hypothetical protein QCA50_008427 [Cerrena zonata]|uniref:Uncharacterized protein n=1 Tax=Cerrena zonata TaxID=2478898 RepID=A0AAW0G6L7_9APHY
MRNHLPQKRKAILLLWLQHVLGHSIRLFLLVAIELYDSQIMEVFLGSAKMNFVAVALLSVDYKVLAKIRSPGVTLYRHPELSVLDRRPRDNSRNLVVFSMPASIYPAERCVYYAGILFPATTLTSHVSNRPKWFGFRKDTYGNLPAHRGSTLTDRIGITVTT